MADSWLIMAVKVNDHSAADMKNKIFPGTIGGSSGTSAKWLTRRFVSAVGTLLRNLMSGAKRGLVFGVVLDNSATYSTGNIACTQANAAGNTITFTYGAQTVVLTEGASGENGFARGASDTTCAANLATCINAHSILGPLLTALGSSGNCGLTANVPTALLQDMAMTTDDATAFAFTQLTSGTEGAAQFFPAYFETNTSS